MGRVNTPITKPLPYFESFLSFWKNIIHDHGELSEGLQYFLEFQKQRNNNKETRRG